MEENHRPQDEGHLMMAKPILRGPLLGLTLALAGSIAAAQPLDPGRPSRPPPVFDPDQMARAEALAREAIARLLGAFDAFVQSLPQYGPPEINDRDRKSVV